MRNEPRRMIFKIHILAHKILWAIWILRSRLKVAMHLQTVSLLFDRSRNCCWVFQLKCNSMNTFPIFDWCNAKITSATRKKKKQILLLFAYFSISSFISFELNFSIFFFLRDTLVFHFSYRFSILNIKHSPNLYTKRDTIYATMDKESAMLRDWKDEKRPREREMESKREWERECVSGRVKIKFSLRKNETKEQKPPKKATISQVCE